MRTGLFFLSFIVVALTTKAQDSLDIKIGQMIMIGIKDYYDMGERSKFLESVRNNRVGGVIIYEKNLLPIDTKKELAAMNLEIIKKADIPLFFSIDEEGGRVNRLKEKYGFPATYSAEKIAGLEDLDSTFYYASRTAETLYSIGFNVNYAPVVDVNVNKENPVIGKLERSYSDDYLKVINQAGTFVKAHNQYKVATTLKHFPGHGSSADDTHLGIADVSQTWQLEELYPYKALIDSGWVSGVMTAHIVNRSLDPTLKPATLSKEIIQGVLRDFLGFEGVVFSDDMHMGAISQHYGFEEAVVLAINAGVDILLFSNNVFDYQLTTADELHALIRKKVKEGEIDESRINESFERIMLLKKNLGLLEPDFQKEMKRQLKAVN